MFSLAKTIREINNDRHRKYVSIPEEKPSPKKISIKKHTPPLQKSVKKKNTKINVSTQTSPVRMVDVSCDTKELDQKEKEQKALLAFKKRIEDQKVKAEQMKQFLGTTNTQGEEDDLEDE
tara:strand:+ start:1153 stop:1512 length:360 start_codon:yes stop_codon:yes gene_type:complete